MSCATTVRLRPALLVATVLMSGCVSAPPRPDGVTGDTTVLAAEHRRFQAMVSVDERALDTLLAEELTYTHTTGNVDSKASLLDALRTGRLAYDSISPGEVRVRVYERTAVATGTARIQARADGVVRRFSIRYTEAYVRRAERWQLVAWQSTRTPEP